MSGTTIPKDNKLTDDQAPVQSETTRNSGSIDDCVKPHVAETSRLDDSDDACFDSIG